MQILGLEKVSMVDYPGKVCATVFTGGCNYRCKFCHNSGIVNKNYSGYEEDCIFDYLASRKSLIKAVTISGGEPTLQKDLRVFIERLKSESYLVKLDTNGTNPFVLNTLIRDKLIDYVAMDIKTCFDDYNTVTNVKDSSVDNVKRSFEILLAGNVDYELRTTLVKEFHDKDKIAKMAEDIKGAKRLYLQKFKNSATCFDATLTPVSFADANIFKDILSQTVGKVEFRGY